MFRDSLNEEPAQFGMFLQRVPGVIEQGLFSFYGRPVLVLLVGGVGKGSGAGFLVGRFFLWLSGRLGRCSGRGVGFLSASVA